MMEILNEVISGNITYTNGDYRIQGDYKINPNTKKVDSMNVSIYKDETYSGNVNVYTDNNGELTSNYNNMLKIEISPIDDEITLIIQELEVKYNTLSLSL